MIAGPTAIRNTHQRSLLANAVAASASNAYLTGPGVTTANITSSVQNISGPRNAAATVSVAFDQARTGNPAPGWYCVTGSGVTLPTWTARTHGDSCSNGSAAGSYVTFNANYTNNGLMNGFLAPASMTMTEQVTVRVK